MTLPTQLQGPFTKWVAATVALAVALAAYWATGETVPLEAAGTHYGWVADADAVEAVRASRPGGAAFADTEAFRATYRGPDDVFLWEAAKAVTGAVLPARNQGQVGACVGFGTAAAVEHLMCVELAAGSSSVREFRPVAPEAIYAGSRVEIGGGRVSGDGSIGAWAAEFVRRYGIVPRGKYAAFDLTSYSERTCRELGRTGLGVELDAVAKTSPVRGTAIVANWNEARAAIRQGYPIAVCSRQGFRMERDRDGFCPPSGVWYHCMALVGVRGGARPGGFLVNSWGDAAHTGPRSPADAPRCGFWVDAAVLDRMLGDGDSWAFSGFPGFPARRIDWYAQALHETPAVTGVAE